MKKFLVLLVVIILSLSAVGCAEIRVTRIMCADSSVIDRVEVVLDEEIANANGYTLNVLKQEVEKLLKLNGYDVVESDNDYTVTGEIIYETLAEFREVYGGNDDDEGLTEGFLFDTYGEYQSTPFSALITNGTVKWVKDEYFSNFSDEALEDVRYGYVYATTYKSIESDGLVTEKDGYYVHEWSFTAHEAEYGKMYVSQIVPNTTGWYFIAIVVALAIVAIGYALVAIKRKRKEIEEDSYGR